MLGLEVCDEASRIFQDFTGSAKFGLIVGRLDGLQMTKLSFVGVTRDRSCCSIFELAYKMVTVPLRSDRVPIECGNRFWTSFS